VRPTEGETISTSGKKQGKVARRRGGIGRGGAGRTRGNFKGRHASQEKKKRNTREQTICPPCIASLVLGKRKENSTGKKQQRRLSSELRDHGNNPKSTGNLQKSNLHPFQSIESKGRSEQLLKLQTPTKVKEVSACAEENGKSRRNLLELKTFFKLGWEKTLRKRLRLEK